jgi:hypothetical protein
MANMLYNGGTARPYTCWLHLRMLLSPTMSVYWLSLLFAAEPASCSKVLLLLVVVLLLLLQLLP